MGKTTFLDELSGDLVRHLRTSPQVTVDGTIVPSVASMVGEDQNARIFPEVARFGAAMPQIVYTQAGGHSPKTLEGPDGCEEITLHIYAYAIEQPRSRLLARAILQRCVDGDNSMWGAAVGNAGTAVHVCNGGIIDTGVHEARDQSDKKSFWTRLVLKLVIS